MEKGLEKARREKESGISKAEKKAQDLLDKEKEQIRKEMDALLSDKEKELSAKKKIILAKGKAERNSIMKQASSNMEETVDYILKLFEDKVNE